MVIGEETLCYSILSNLLTNAIESSPADGRVKIFLDDLGRESMIRIHNQEMIPESVQANFFEKYVTYGKQAGTGLGTYSARLFTEIMGGRIGFETSRENGTTLSVILPRP